MPLPSQPDPAADPIDESHSCLVCGARGLAQPCDLVKHAASIVGFAAYQTRENRLAACRRAKEITP